MSSVAETGVWPQGLRSDTDQLYCLILQKSLTSLSLRFLFCLHVSRSHPVAFIFQINAIKLIPFPCSLRSGHTGLCAFSRAFRTYNPPQNFYTHFPSPRKYFFKITTWLSLHHLSVFPHHPIYNDNPTPTPQTPPAPFCLLSFLHSTYHLLTYYMFTYLASLSPTSYPMTTESLGGKNFCLLLSLFRTVSGT